MGPSKNSLQYNIGLPLDSSVKDLLGIFSQYIIHVFYKWSMRSKCIVYGGVKVFKDWYDSRPFASDVFGFFALTLKSLANFSRVKELLSHRWPWSFLAWYNLLKISLIIRWSSPLIEWLKVQCGCIWTYGHMYNNCASKNRVNFGAFKSKGEYHLMAPIVANHN